MQYPPQPPAQCQYQVVYFTLFYAFLFTSLTRALDLAAPITAPIFQGDDTNGSFIVFDAPCTSWEQTQAALIAMGVPHGELGRWYDLYLWQDIQNALQNGWDPREEIEKYLIPFFEYLGNRKFRCVAPVRHGRQGEVCGWEGTKKDRTISHICGHLGYNAYICNGQCGRANW